MGKLLHVEQLLSVLLQFLGSNPTSENGLLSLWYLDDGTLIGSRSSLLALLLCFTHSGPNFGLHINLPKCEPYWPSGDCSFPGFPHVIKCVNPVSSGLELLGAPVWGTPTFFESFCLINLTRLPQLAELRDP